MIFGNAAIENNLIPGGVIECTDEIQVNPASVNIRLGNSFSFIDADDEIKLGDEMPYRSITVPDGGVLYLAPGAFCLATTREKVNLPLDIAAFVHGRSSMGRIALSVQNAGYVDPGFTGHITLELKNDTSVPIGLIPGYPVGQLVFMGCVGVTKGYDGKYNGQVEATGSRMHLD